jgi:hypothetical protein
MCHPKKGQKLNSEELRPQSRLPVFPDLKRHLRFHDAVTFLHKFTTSFLRLRLRFNLEFYMSADRQHPTRLEQYPFFGSIVVIWKNPVFHMNSPFLQYKGLNLVTIELHVSVEFCSSNTEPDATLSEAVLCEIIQIWVKSFLIGI